MSRKNSLTLKRGTTIVIAEGCFAIAALTVMGVTYILMMPFRSVSNGISRMTSGLLTHNDD